MPAARIPADLQIGGLEKMSKRKSVTGEVLHDVQNAYDSILKTTELRSKGIHVCCSH